MQKLRDYFYTPIQFTRGDAFMIYIGIATLFFHNAVN